MVKDRRSRKGNGRRERTDPVHLRVANWAVLRVRRNPKQPRRSWCWDAHLQRGPGLAVLWRPSPSGSPRGAGGGEPSGQLGIEGSQTGRKASPAGIEPGGAPIDQRQQRAPTPQQTVQSRMGRTEKQQQVACGGSGGGDRVAAFRPALATGVGRPQGNRGANPTARGSSGARGSETTPLVDKGAAISPEPFHDW
jgi:hypothetical protein